VINQVSWRIDPDIEFRIKDGSFIRVTVFIHIQNGITDGADRLLAIGITSGKAPPGAPILTAEVSADDIAKLKAAVDFVHFVRGSHQFKLC